MKLKTVDIGSVCLETIQRDPQREPDKEFVYVDIASVDNQAKRINATQRILGKDAPSRARKEIRSGDVLVSTVRPNLNAVAFVPPTLDGQIASTGFCVLRPNPVCIDNRYLFYRTTWTEFVEYLSSRVTGANYPAVSDSVIKSAPIPLPPLPIQKQIAAVLEKADAAREKRRQADQLTDQFLQSAFLEMFGDPVTNPNHWKKGILGEAIEYSEYGTSVKSNDEKRGHPVLGMGNVTYEGLLDLNVLKYVELPDDEYKKLRLRRGDIIFNRTNSTELVGKTAFWNLEMDAVLASYLVKLRLTRAFDSAWFSALLNTDYFKKFFMQRCKKAVGQSNISPTLLKEFPMYMPPLEEQKTFAALSAKVESLRAKQRESEKELENLFNSLMQKAFKGELV